MSIIPTVGRRSWSMRLLIAGLYIVLTLGAITMVYPFLIMLATSTKSGVDVNNYSVIPKYWYDDSILFAKFAEIKYAADMDAINGYYRTDFAKMEDIAPPQKTPLTTNQMRMVKDWEDFSRTIPLKYMQANYGVISNAPSRLLNEYRAWLRRRFNNDINALNKLYREENESFETVFTPFERTESREWQPEKTPKMQEWLEFKASLPSEFRRIICIDPLFWTFLKENKYDGDIAKLNKAYGTNYKSFMEVHFSPTLPADPRQRADWEEFARTMLPFRYMVLNSKALPAYRKFLQNRYGGNIEEVNRIYGTSYSSFDQIVLPKEAPAEGTPLVDWMDFISKVVPVTAIKAVNSENLYRQYLFRKYGSLDAINKAYGTKYASLLDLSPPQHLADWHYVLAHHRELRKHFIIRNYAMVLNYILLHGRAVFNTFVFCLAAILTHLIVNPLCAYSLSRYNLRYSYKVLLFLLATMAFPAEVTLIPNFLLLKKLHMLNTFWALILPGMAGGFSIFLLKGFFDSLPKELYEAGIIDGASEARMFWQITIPLSKPIFAVIALSSFTAAYGAFMFAFLVCQNPKMWTMMVWLYELQITAPKYITMAALTIAAIPTLTVFVFAQNVIMRGIILPSFK
ncbi:MAG: beta-galactosidase [Armatimonadetes bacterium]|nr:beta-galactosidase [Armatimonadota bacterium]